MKEFACLPSYLSVEEESQLLEKSLAIQTDDPASPYYEELSNFKDKNANVDDFFYDLDDALAMAYSSYESFFVGGGESTLNSDYQNKLPECWKEIQKEVTEELRFLPGSFGDDHLRFFADQFELTEIEMCKILAYNPGKRALILGSGIGDQWNLEEVQSDLFYQGEAASIQMVQARVAVSGINRELFALKSFLCFKGHHLPKNLLKVAIQIYFIKTLLAKDAVKYWDMKEDLKTVGFTPFEKQVVDYLWQWREFYRQRDALISQGLNFRFFYSLSPMIPMHLMGMEIWQQHYNQYLSQLQGQALEDGSPLLFGQFAVLKSKEPKQLKPEFLEQTSDDVTRLIQKQKLFTPLLAAAIVQVSIGCKMKLMGMCHAKWCYLIDEANKMVRLSRKQMEQQLWLGEKFVRQYGGTKFLWFDCNDLLFEPKKQLETLHDLLQGYTIFENFRGCGFISPESILGIQKGNKRANIHNIYEKLVLISEFTSYSIISWESGDPDVLKAYGKEKRADGSDKEREAFFHEALIQLAALLKLREQTEVRLQTFNQFLDNNRKKAEMLLRSVKEGKVVSFLNQPFVIVCNNLAGIDSTSYPGHESKTGMSIAHAIPYLKLLSGGLAIVSFSHLHDQSGVVFETHRAFLEQIRSILSNPGIPDDTLIFFYANAAKGNELYRAGDFRDSKRFSDIVTGEHSGLNLNQVIDDFYGDGEY